MRTVKAVTPMNDYKLFIEFDNGKTGIHNMMPYLDKPVFSFLRNKSYFDSVYIEYGAVTWKDEDGNEVDLCPDALYMIIFDPDYTKLTPKEAEELKEAENSGYINEKDINWDNLEEYL